MNQPAALQSSALAKSLPALRDGERWYVAHCQPGAEARAQHHLANQKFRTFFPKRRKTVRHARTVKLLHAPYFPRYLFVVLDLSRDRWRSVNSTVGISRLLTDGDRPCPVPYGVVEALMASADDHGVLEVGDNLFSGQLVRLIAGPFADQLAVLDRLDGPGRVSVLLTVLGRLVSIPTDRAAVVPEESS